MRWCNVPGSISHKLSSAIDSETPMGKGDLRTRRGKIYNGSFGKKRPGRVKKAAEKAPAPAAKSSGRGR
jgi:30S ribosomal protein S31